MQRYEKNAYFCSYQSNKSAYEQTIPTNWFNAYPTGSDKFRKLYTSRKLQELSSSVLPTVAPNIILNNFFMSVLYYF